MKELRDTRLIGRGRGITKSRVSDEQGVGCSRRIMPFCFQVIPRFGEEHVGHQPMLRTTELSAAAFKLTYFIGVDVGVDIDDVGVDVGR